jgi:hypothetical protein
MTLMKFAPLTDFDLLERTLYTWANKSTGLEVVWVEDENAPQVDRPHVALDIELISDVTGRLEIEEYDEATDQLKRSYASMQYVDVVADVFTYSTKPHENAMRFCDALITGLDSSEYKEQLFEPAGMGVLSTGDIQKIPLLEDDLRWRSRAQIQCRFSIASNLADAESLDYIKSAALTGTITGGTLDPLTAATSVAATS